MSHAFPASTQQERPRWTHMYPDSLVTLFLTHLTFDPVRSSHCGPQSSPWGGMARVCAIDVSDDSLCVCVTNAVLTEKSKFIRYTR